MTTTEEVAERVLPAAFAAQANTCADPQDVLAAVRGRARRQRTARPALMVAAVAGAVAAVVGISATVVNLAGNHTPNDQQIAAASGTQSATTWPRCSTRRSSNPSRARRACSSSSRSAAGPAGPTSGA